VIQSLKSGPARQALLLSVGLWLVAFGFYIAPGLAQGVVTEKGVQFLCGCAFTGMLLSAGLYVLISRTRRLSRAGWAAVTVAGVVGATLLHALIDTAVYEHLFHFKARLSATGHLDAHALNVLNNFLLLSAVYIIYAGGLALTFSAQALQERERSLAAALARAQEAQLAALRFQINPHFLFNALNAVTSLIGAGRNAEAGAVVQRLADFFRASLTTSPGAFTQLDEELDIVSSYLEIEAARFGPRLVVEIEAPDELADALVPPFLVQPLVENAIKHGVARSKRPVRVTVSAEAEGEQLRLAVRDDGEAGGGPPAAGAGVGLENVAQRLGVLFGDRGELRTRRLENGYLAEIRLPLARAAGLLRAAE